MGIPQILTPDGPYPETPTGQPVSFNLSVILLGVRRHLAGVESALVLVFFWLGWGRESRIRLASTLC